MIFFRDILACFNGNPLCCGCGDRGVRGDHGVPSRGVLSLPGVPFSLIIASWLR